MAEEQRLIDPNVLKRQFVDYVRTSPHFHYGDWQNMCINGTEIDEVIANAPTVEAVEVIHARWVKVFDDSAGWVDMCNSCKEFGDGKLYCSMCGAKMDGGNESD